MKVLLLINLILLLGVHVSGKPERLADCNSFVLAQNSIQELPQGFNFLKSYRIDNDNGNKRKVEFSYVFTSGTSYALNVHTPSNPNDIFLSIYDSDRNLIASNVINNKPVNIITVLCQATGIYYMSYTFSDSLSHCAGSSLGFKRR